MKYKNVNDYEVIYMIRENDENAEKLIAKCEKEAIHCASIQQIGSTIGAHIGSGGYGLIYVTI